MHRALMAAILAALLSLPAFAGAQQLTVSRLNDLDFGTLIAGTSRSVDPASSSAAKFEVRGNFGSRVTISFSLPAELRDGTKTLPITFDGNSAGWSFQDAGNMFRRFDPRQGTVALILFGGRIYVYLGGTVTAGTGQPAGQFSETVTISTAVN